MSAIQLSLCPVKKVCPECPFSRAVEPGALGGSHPLKYVAQAMGPFALPCHMHCDFNDPQWRQKSFATPQCLGAATFRANVGVQDRLPEAFERVPENHEDVFSSFAEFLAHHTNMPLALATEILNQPGFLAELLRKELANKAVIRKEVS